MLAVHWTPVKNTKHILKNGITKSRNGLYCFPLTGHKSLDRWWIYFFNQCGVRSRKKYNGIIFRIKQDDMPAYFGHWIGATTTSEFKKTIVNVKDLGKKFEQIILFRLGETVANKLNGKRRLHNYKKTEEIYLNLAAIEIKKHPKLLAEKMNSLDFMTYAFYDYQIVLSKSIPADRIVKVIPQGNESGTVLKKQKALKMESNQF